MLNHLGLVVSYVTLAGRGGGRKGKKTTDLSSSDTPAQMSTSTTLTILARQPSNPDPDTTQRTSARVTGRASNAEDVMSRLDARVSLGGSDLQGHVDGTGGGGCEVGGLNRSADVSGGGEGGPEEHKDKARGQGEDEVERGEMGGSGSETGRNAANGDSQSKRAGQA